ncbi:MAG: M16 family metallopeptidase [Candidatus Comchoanobacterales bacterium]
MTVFSVNNTFELPVYQWNHGSPDLLYITISWTGGILYSDSKILLSAWRSMMFTGAKGMTKQRIWEVIEGYGADVSIELEQRRLMLHISCPSQHLQSIWPLIMKCLQEAEFDQQEWLTIQKRLIAQRKANNDQVEYVAHEHLYQQLFPKNHICYALNSEDVIKELSHITCQDLAVFHKKVLSSHQARFFVAGSLTDQALSGLVKDWFSLPSHEPTKAPYQLGVSDHQGHSVKKVMPNKKTVSVYWAKILPLSQKHADFPALVLANYILGGNFTAHLMQTIREQQGLTYGIYSSLSGFGDEGPGVWAVRASFSPELYQQGCDATNDQLKHWFSDWDEQRIKDKKKGWLGAQQVGRASVSAVLKSVRWSVDQGYGLDYHSVLMDKVKNVNYQQVKKVVEEYLHPESSVCIQVGGLI